MDYNVNRRVVDEALYIIENKATVRSTAKIFGLGKSTVHKDMTERLKYIDKNLYDRVIEVLQINKKERHLRGGIATKNKYKGLK